MRLIYWRPLVQINRVPFLVVYNLEKPVLVSLKNYVWSLDDH